MVIKAAVRNPRRPPAACAAGEARRNRPRRCGTRARASVPCCDCLTHDRRAARRANDPAPFPVASAAARPAQRRARDSRACLCPSPSLRWTARARPARRRSRTGLRHRRARPWRQRSVARAGRTIGFRAVMTAARPGHTTRTGAGAFANRRALSARCRLRDPRMTRRALHHADRCAQQPVVAGIGRPRGFAIRTSTCVEVCACRRSTLLNPRVHWWQPRFRRTTAEGAGPSRLAAAGAREQR